MGERIPGWLSRSRMTLSRPWMAIVPHLLRPHGGPDALRLAQGVIRRWATPMARLRHWRRLSGYVQGIGLGPEYIYRTRQLRQWRRPRATIRVAPTTYVGESAARAETVPGLALPPWQEDAGRRTEDRGPLEPALTLAPSLEEWGPFPPPSEPEAWISALPLQEAPEATQGAAEPVWPERRGQPWWLPLLRQVLSRYSVPSYPPVYRLPHHLTDRPISLSRHETGRETLPPYLHRLTALSDDVLIRHGVTPLAPAQRQPFEPAGMMPRLLRQVIDRPLIGGRVAAIAAEPPRTMPPHEIVAPFSKVGLAPQPTPGPPATTPWPEAIAGEPVSAQPPPAQAAQPPAGPGVPAPEARATPPEIETRKERETAERHAPQPPRPPRRFSSPPALHFEARPGQERPVPQGQWTTSLSRQILSRYAITMLALTRPALILRSQHPALSVETTLPPYRLATWPEDILVRYGLSPEPTQPTVKTGSWIQPPGVAPGVEEEESEAGRRAPEAVRHLPRWPPRGLGRLAAEALERTLGVVPGEQVPSPATPGRAQPLQAAFLPPALRIIEGEEEIAFPSLAPPHLSPSPSLERRGELEVEMEEATGLARPPGRLRELRRRPPRRAMPAGAIVPEVLFRAADWLAPRAEAALSFLGAVGAVFGPRPQEGTAQVQREWPALGLIRRLVRPAPFGEPAALQVLRRMSPAQSRLALAAIQSLPSLGAGEPLPTLVRRPLEAILGRDLAGVRLYTSPVASALGAEAFTSGERIVFAPGRLDVRSRHGLALIGHELAHLGQPLAFKQSPGAGPAVVDREEGEAKRQEAIIRRIAEEGWPVGPRMEVRRRVWTEDKGGRVEDHTGLKPGTGPSPVLRPPSLLDSATGLRFERLAIQPGPAQPVIQRARADGRASVGQFSESATAPLAAVADQPGGPDLDALARQVYSLLKARLRAERDRHQLYSR